MIASVARWSYRRRWLMLAFWVVLLVGSNVLAKSTGGEFKINFSLPGADSQQAQDLLKAHFPAQAGATAELVYASPSTIDDPAVKKQVQDLIAQIKTVPQVSGVVSPYDGGRGAFQVAKDRKIAYADIEFNVGFEKVTKANADKIAAFTKAASQHNLQAELSGAMFQARKPPGGTEMIGILAAIIILLIAFGSVLAMGLPIIVALFGIGIGLAGVTLLANVMSMPEFATQLAAMIGIGVGIDYALFIVTRYRQSLQQGLDPEASVVRAIATAGKAVLFAGCTVVISLLGMYTMGLDFVRGLATGASLAVAITMVASITLLPAVLGFVGVNIDKWSLPWTQKGDTSHRHGFWWRWSRFIQRRSWPAAIIGFLILATLAIPAFSIRMGNSDASNLPTSDTTRRAYDLLSEGFGPGFNGPLYIAVSVPNDAARASLPKVQQAIASTPGIASITPPIPGPDGKVALLRAFPTTGPQDEATVKLIHHLRSDVIPAAQAGTGLSAHVGGTTAAFDDVAGLLASRLPIFIAAVLGLSFLLLLAVFRSVLVPLKAVIMNLLSIGAAYGLLVAVFQWGWGASLIGVGHTGPIESFVPMMMFAILFGLSMDYEVFLLSRVKEEYDLTGDNATAVADGLSHTARVITAAAAIMVCVFGSFVFGDNRVVKEFGLGLAFAIFIDATIVRMILVPATMELLGDANWWFPKWLDKIVPKIHIEAEPIEDVQAAVQADTAPDEEPVPVA